MSDPVSRPASGLALVWRLGAATTLIVTAWGGTLGPVASGSALQAGGGVGLAVVLSVLAVAALRAARLAPGR